jgi:hypothetical protein
LDPIGLRRIGRRSVPVHRPLLALTIALGCVPLGSTLAYAQFPCPTSHDGSIQQALDNAAAAGGGTVFLPAGVFNVCQTLVIGSNVHLRGAGRGATILRGSTAVGGKFVDGAYLGTTIGAAGANNVTVSDLTIDHLTHSRNANGISFVPTGSSYTGIVPTNILVERVEVLASNIGHHNYLIWNFKGQHVKIRDNWLDGGYGAPIAAPQPQEGIESFGGVDVLITGNTVRGVAGACINVGSAGIPDSTTMGVTVSNNFLYGCHMGVNLGTSAENGGQHNLESKIVDNFIYYATLAGINIPVQDGTTQRNLEITGNTIRSTGPGPFATGIRISAYPGSEIVSVLVARNTIDTVTGLHGQGITAFLGANVRVLDNLVSKTSGSAIVGYQSNDVEIARNRIDRPGSYGIYLGPTIERVIVLDNLLIDWAPVSPAILLESVSFGAVHRNLFRRSDGAEPTAIIQVQSCGLELSGNQSLYRHPANNGATAPCR